MAEKRRDDAENTDDEKKNQQKIQKVSSLQPIWIPDKIEFLRGKVRIIK